MVPLHAVKNLKIEKMDWKIDDTLPNRLEDEWYFTQCIKASGCYKPALHWVHKGGVACL